MADASGLGIVLSELFKAEETAQEESPFAPLGSAADLFGSTLIKSSPNFSVKDNVKAGLISGLVKGLSNNLTRNYVDEQNSLATDYILGGGDVQPEGLSNSIYNRLKKARSIYSLQRQAENADARTALESKIVEKIIENPDKAKRGLAVAGALLGGQDVQTPAAQPGSFEFFLEKNAGNEAAAKAEYDLELTKPSRLQDLRKEFSALPEVRSFVQSDIGFRSLQKAIKDPSSTSDLELVRGAIQAIEPGMAVREGEQAAVYSSGSIPEQWKGALTKALTGETGLPENVRAGILRIAERRFQEHSANFSKARQFYMNQAKQGGLDPTGITYLEESEPQAEEYQVLMPGQETGGIPQGARDTGRTSGGKPVYEVNGQLWVP